MYIIFTMIFIWFLLLFISSMLLLETIDQLFKRYNISDTFLAIILLSCITSLPELSTSLYSTYMGHAHLGFGNIIGSNIFNTLIILSICGLITKIKVEEQWKRYFLLTIITYIYVLYKYITHSTVFIDMIIPFIALSVFSFKSDPSSSIDDRSSIYDKFNIYIIIIILILSSILLIISSKFIFINIVHIVHLLHLEEGILGLSIMAIGTSLPELVVCVISSIRKKSNVILGLVIGSNIYNISFILFSMSIIGHYQINISTKNTISIILLLISSILFIKYQSKVIYMISIAIYVTYLYIIYT